MYAGAFNRGGQCWRRVEGAYRNLVFTVYKRCSVSADPKVRRRLVPSKCFSPCLLCCVCWPRNWDLLRSLWLSRSVSCWKDKERKKRVTQESNQNHPILFLRSQCLLLQNWLNAPTTSVLRSSVWGQLEITTISRWRSRFKRSSHDEQHASASWKSNDLFYFPSCTSDREGDGCPECPKQPIYNSSFKTTSFCGSNLHRERIVAAGGRSQRSGCSILADGEETGEVWSRARKGGGMNMKPALLLGLWCLTLSHSTGESAAQTRLLWARVHTHTL